MKTFILLLILAIPLLLVGQTFTTFDTSNSGLWFNESYCLLVDQDDNIWICSLDDANGNARVSKLHNNLITWTIFPPESLKLDLLGEDRVTDIAQDDAGTIWFGTRRAGVSYLKLDGTSASVPEVQGTSTRALIIDSESKIYISERTNGYAWVSEDNGTTWTTWNSDTLVGMVAGQRPEIYDVRVATDGRIWLCTHYGVWYKNTDNSFGQLYALNGYYTTVMAIDHNDHLWVGTDNSVGLPANLELWEILPDTTYIIHDNTEVPPLQYLIQDIETDANGHLWLATDGGLLKIIPGTVPLSYQLWDHASTGGGIPIDQIRDLAIQDSILWLNTDVGITRIDGLITFTGINENSNQIPNDIYLYQNYPNPFNPRTSIQFHLKKTTDVEISIYNLNGQLINVIANGRYQQGNNSVEWDGLDSNYNQVSSGIYLYQLKTKHTQITKKMILLK